MRIGVGIILFLSLGFAACQLQKSPKMSNRRSTSAADAASAGDSGKDIVALRFDAPLRTAEIHRHVLTSQDERAKLVESLKPELGCTADGFKNAVKEEIQTADSDLRIAKIAARGYASGQADDHPVDQKRQQIRFQTLQTGDRWEWSYEFAGASQKFLSQQASEFKTLSMQSGDKKTFRDAMLDVPDDPLAIVLDKPLIFEWSGEALTEQSYVRIQIGPPGQSKPITCWFAADEGSGSIPVEWLAKLATGKNEVFVSLETMQWQDTAADAGPPWLLAMYDWRLGQLNKP